MLDLVDVGEAVRKARKDLRLSQSELAEATGLSRARIDALENGRAGDVGFKNVLRLMNAVGLDLRMGPLTTGSRPTLDDLNEEEDDAPRLGR